MTWEIVVGFGILLGALIPIGGILAKLVHTLTRLDVTLASLNKSVSEDRTKNEQEHKEFCNELQNHEVRIIGIEKERGIK